MDDLLQISTAINDSKFPESLKSALQLLNERLRSLEQQAKQRELLLAEKDIDQKEFQVRIKFSLLKVQFSNVLS